MSNTFTKPGQEVDQEIQETVSTFSHPETVVEGETWNKVKKYGTIALGAGAAVAGGAYAYKNRDKIAGYLGSEKAANPNPDTVNPVDVPDPQGSVKAPVITQPTAAPQVTPQQKLVNQAKLDAQQHEVGKVNALDKLKQQVRTANPKTVADGRNARMVDPTAAHGATS